MKAIVFSEVAKLFENEVFFLDGIFQCAKYTTFWFYDRENDYAFHVVTKGEETSFSDWAHRANSAHEILKGAGYVK